MKAYVELRRTASFVDGVTNIPGIRGLMVIRSAEQRVLIQLPTVERGGDTVRLPTGRYVYEHSEMIRRPGERCLRIKSATTGTVLTVAQADCLRRRSLLIHVANYPGELVGCIAPGLTEIARGVGHSAAAFEQLCKGLGGFELGKTFELVVLG